MNQLPQIVIKGFFTTYTAKGEEIDWIKYSPQHDPQNSETIERVKFLMPTDKLLEDDSKSGKADVVRYKWGLIEPAYNAWKAGQELPENGTPLAAWAGLSPEQAEVFKRSGIKSVEAIRDMTESQINKIQLPNTRLLKTMAGEYLDSRSSTEMAARLAEKDEQMASMKAMIEEMAGQIADLQSPGEPPQPKRGPGRPRKEPGPIEDSEAA